MKKKLGNSIPRRKRPGGGNIRPYFTTRYGRRVWARDYGYEGWPIGGRSR